MFIKFVLSLILVIILLPSFKVLAEQPPNILIFIADDLGWGDISPYNDAVDWTPNIQRLADEGTTYTQFYTPMAVCTPFRYSLLTGLSPVNDDMINGAVVNPNDPRGISLELTTLPERLQSLGYRTASIGKWHLSIGNANATHGPHAQGFDFRRGLQHDPVTGESIPLRFENLPINYTIAAKHFLETTPENQPYFLYVAYTTPHVPLFSHFEGVTGQGLYADTVYEIDWSMGEILRYVDMDNTIVMFISDNGPFQPDLNAAGEPVIPAGWAIRQDLIDIYGDTYTDPKRWHGGSNVNHFGIDFHPPEYDTGGAKALNTGKSSHWEGGIRVAAIIRWLDGEPGAIDGKAHQVMDVYATLEDMLGGGITHAVDGTNLRTGIADVVFVYTAPGGVGQLSAIILDGRWKYHIDSGALYDLSIDPGESTDVAETNAGIMAMIRGRLRGERYLPMVWGK